MTVYFERLRRSVSTFWADTTGVMLPYVALMMVVFIGLGALALDGGRALSMQTQMQAMADGWALAGARELNQQSGAITRATNAINNMVTTNALTGLGYSGSFTHSVNFYSSLNAANVGGGITTTDDLQARYVRVIVNPVTVSTMFPISFFKAGGSNSFSAGAQATAGFTSQTYCDIPPVFICNPYETAGMTDSQATAALRTNIALPSVQRKQVRLDPAKSGPGQFGYLVPPDGCTGASCLEDWIAQAKPKACYQSASVDLNTGYKASVTDGFNVRFDIYKGNLKKYQNSAAYAPATNVRQGHVRSACNSTAGTPYPFLSQTAASTGAIYPNATTTTATGDFDNTGNSNCSNSGNKSCVIKNVSPAIVSQVYGWIAAGLPVSVVATTVGAGSTIDKACRPADVGTAPCSNAGAGANTLIMHAPANVKQAGVSMTVGLSLSGLPMDTNLYNNTLTFGNGQWDCDSYWRINHPGVAKPADIASGCLGAASTTVSRYSVYLSEINNNLVSNFSLPGSTLKNGENGAPTCSSTGGVAASPTQTDRRVIFSAVINCLAQGPFGGGQTANNIPVAGFAKFFMSQPIGANGDGTGYIYGEMSGLVGSLDEVQILNQVQLYR
ncbi:pilus assembly protein TadG-related protein [Bradyrhizobium sp. BWC-3-1]|uniref:pilus assembly protein TadG-related protein n=1 Tax=Bradyrhizobium sp. BWC-3-1 TaxID=3080012 RepID=UPI00293EA144|nr:pilus assembly protein TadG-related protein [Bradyrhizobium sp. BWC-3-1]WOH56040.1 pilus assembly protein TadG-related protein [Bradyrhizobium sp. BWC-3-1]